MNELCYKNLIINFNFSLFKKLLEEKVNCIIKNKYFIQSSFLSYNIPKYCMSNLNIIIKDITDIKMSMLTHLVGQQ